MGRGRRRAGEAGGDRPRGRALAADLDRAADRLAAGLAYNGVQRGDRVATLPPNSLEAVIAIYGIFRAGAAISPSTRRSRPASSTMLDDSRARALICDDERVSTRRGGRAGRLRAHVQWVESVPTGEAGLQQAALGRPRRGRLHPGLTGELKGVAVPTRR